ncbi:MAG: hypothetical protein Q4D54_03215 [Eubacteriales bacterium]|nr:hypothetical protein [Eubacteriales bacterium]
MPETSPVEVSIVIPSSAITDFKVISPVQLTASKELQVTSFSLIFPVLVDKLIEFFTLTAFRVICPVLVEILIELLTSAFHVIFAVPASISTSSR